MDVPAKYIDEVSPALVAAVGFVMLVFPEPATSAFGAGLLLFGLAWWFFEWGRDPTAPDEPAEPAGAGERLEDRRGEQGQTVDDERSPRHRRD